LSLRTASIAFLTGILFAIPGQGADPEFTIVIRDHRFEPVQVQVPAGKKFRIVIDNQDSSPEEFESYALNREKHIGPNSRVTIFLGPLDPGRYLFEGESKTRGRDPALGVIEAH
jgi:hypothetical protein